MYSRAQTKALAHVQVRAEAAAPGAQTRIAAILARNAGVEGGLGPLVGLVREQANVTLNFHPDRLRSDGTTVAEGLLRDGRYRNQFEVLITNGSPTAFLGGERDRWEEQLFGGAYQESGVLAGERPLIKVSYPPSPASRLCTDSARGASGLPGTSDGAPRGACRALLRHSRRARRRRAGTGSRGAPSGPADMEGVGDARGDVAAYQAALACSGQIRARTPHRSGGGRPP